MTYGQLQTEKTAQETRDDIRETFRKWARRVHDFDILPRERNSAEAGVEYWVNQQKRRLTCSRFYDYEANIRAIWKTLEALRLADERGILRELAEAAAGFLEAPRSRTSRPWHEVLGVMPMADPEVIKAAYKASARAAHPDTGGTSEAMAEVNAAWEQAKAERKIA